MAEIVEFPVEAGGVLRVQAVGSWVEDEEELVAATGIREKVVHAGETLESALGSLTPALGVVTRQLRKLAPDEVTVEFGLVLGVEHGIVVAKGTAEVHFTVTRAWKGAAGAPDAAGGEDAANGPGEGG
jgi:hypothetical protein